uniref:RRM domain-containing protein n=1 Tax=Glossina palpalis gambiensis TaxID=67801 RepID=A0A1B0B9I8_9MUSC
MEQPIHQTQMTMSQHHQATTAIHPTVHMSAAAAAAAAAGLPPGSATSGPPGSTATSAGGPPPTHHPFLSSPALASPVSSTNTNTNHPNNPPLAANAPCSTLFVANLGQFVSEHELKEVFSSMPGFCRLRMHTKGTHNITSSSTTTTFTNTNTTTTNSTCTITNNTNNDTNITNSTISNNHKYTATALAAYGNGSYQQQHPFAATENVNHPVAFIEFNDARSAATAMQHLQGKYLLSSDREEASSELKASEGAGMESRHDLLNKKIERDLQPQQHHHHHQHQHHQQHQQFLMTTPT